METAETLQESSIVSKENAPHYTWADQCDGWHLLGSPDLSVIEELVPPGSAETRHIHHQSRQFFYVLDGNATMEVNGVIHELGKDQGICIPPGAAHQLFNHTENNLRFLVISSPPSHGDRTPA